MRITIINKSEVFDRAFLSISSCALTIVAVTIQNDFILFFIAVLITMLIFIKIKILENEKDYGDSNNKNKVTGGESDI